MTRRFLFALFPPLAFHQGMNFLLGSLVLSACALTVFSAEPRLGTNQTPRDWRAEKRLIDLHLHINSTAEHLRRAVSIMDSVGIGVGVNLSGGTVTSKEGAPSVFERNKRVADELFP